MKIVLVTPAPAGSRAGNRVTAERWESIVRDLGHEAEVVERYDGEPCNLLVALHARRSAGSVERYREAHPRQPLVVALTGTDVYTEIDREEVKRSLALADAIVTLQPLAADELEPSLRSKVRTILQSVSPVASPRAPEEDVFDVLVLGHLRPVKDPLRTAEAVRSLPAGSRIRVTQVGQALGREMERLARREQEHNPRYRFAGEVSRDAALRLLAAARVLVVSSRAEGGANVVSEAIVHGVPVVATRIPGNLGMLGEDYPGYFEVGDTGGLRDLLLRCENEAPYLGRLRERVAREAPRFAPALERDSWRELIDGLGGS